MISQFNSNIGKIKLIMILIPAIFVFILNNWAAALMTLGINAFLSGLAMMMLYNMISNLYKNAQDSKFINNITSIIILIISGILIVMIMASINMNKLLSF